MEGTFIMVPREVRFEATPEVVLGSHEFISFAADSDRTKARAPCDTPRPVDQDPALPTPPRRAALAETRPRTAGRRFAPAPSIRAAAPPRPAGRRVHDPQQAGGLGA